MNTLQTNALSNVLKYFYHINVKSYDFISLKTHEILLAKSTLQNFEYNEYVFSDRLKISHVFQYLLQFIALKNINNPFGGMRI